MAENQSQEPLAKSEGKPLVQTAADNMRDMILAAEPGMRIGSLRSIAEELGVGIVTVQQAARVLEHEGLLDVRRGPGGGYYGRRPDAAALTRALSTYMRADPSSWEEALDMTSLLFNELAASAANCRDEGLHQELEVIREEVMASGKDPAITQLEVKLQDLLFRMVQRPLFEMLTRVTLGIAESWPTSRPFSGLLGSEKWKEGRLRIIGAILTGDEELARFEANRSNRRILMAGLPQMTGRKPSSS